MVLTYQQKSRHRDNFNPVQTGLPDILTYLKGENWRNISLESPYFIAATLVLALLGIIFH